MRLRTPIARRVLASSLALLILATTFVACDQQPSTPAEDPRFQDHGVVAPVSRARGVAATNDADGIPIILAWPADHRGTGSLLVIDARTGETNQIAAEGGYGPSPYANLLSSRNRFYSHFNGRFFEFNANKRTFTFTTKTPDRFAMSLTEGPDGVIWAATYPNSHLMSYDPNTGSFTEYGQMNEETWPQYPRSLAVDKSGWVYIGIGTTEAQIIAFHPETETRRRLAQPKERHTGRPPVWRGTNGRVYGQPYPDGPWYAFYEGAARQISDPPVQEEDILEGSQSAVLRNFPDGWQLEDFDLPEKWARITHPNAEEPEQLTFNYETEGPDVMSVIQGPGNQLYGSTGHPLRMYQFDLTEQSVTHRSLLGLNGHLNALDTTHDLLYMGLYARGGLLEYDPSKSWQDEAETNPNPALLFWATPVIHRPHGLVAHRNGQHVVMGGTPDYGHTGGGLAIYDRDSESHRIVPHTELLEYHSPYTVVGLPDSRVLVGTTTEAGTGGEAQADEAQLFIYDLAAQEITFHEAVIPGVREITDLLLANDGHRVYGVTERRDTTIFFAFDPQNQELLHQEKLPEYGELAGIQGPRVMIQGPDGTLYLLFEEAIVSMDPTSYAHEKLGTPPVDADEGFALHNGRLYFASTSHLWSFPVPD